MITETLKRKEEKHARSRTEDFDEEEGEVLEEEIEQEDEVLEQVRKICWSRSGLEGSEG